MDLDIYIATNTNPSNTSQKFKRRKLFQTHITRHYPDNKAKDTTKENCFKKKKTGINVFINDKIYTAFLKFVSKRIYCIYMQ